MLTKANPSMNPADEDAGTPVSVKIRERIKAARKRFHANDNIADFIEPGELEKLLDEVASKMEGVLDSLVIDTGRDHNTSDTARRVAKMYVKEVFNGRYVKPPAITEFPNAEHLNELMIVGPITVRSACSHHFCPVIGKIWIGVLPNEHTNVIGLSKYARLAEWVMGRPQIQEEAVVQLADLIMEKTQPDGLAIVMEASHYCMAWRGVKDMDSKMINSVMRGVFLKDSTLRREFLALIPQKGCPRCLSAFFTPAAPSTPAPTRSTPSCPSRASTTPRAASPAFFAMAAASSCRPSKAGACPSARCMATSRKTRATRTWPCCTTKRFPSAALAAGPWVRSTCPSSTIPSCSSIQKSPSWTRTRCRAKCPLPCWKN